MHSAVVAVLVFAFAAGFPTISQSDDVCPEGYEVVVVPGAENQCAHPDAAPSSNYRRDSFYAAAAEARSISCVGDGSEGNRLQALYVTEGSPSLVDADRAAIELGMINTTVIYETSSARVGTTQVLPRWVHDAECRPVIEVVSVPSGTLDSFSSTITEIAQRGYNRSDRKYIIWADAQELCGIAAVTMDDAKVNNRNDGTHAGYARIDRGCWAYQGSIVAHEVTHTLGAVLPSAPNATAYGHCTDEYDVMCYDDGPETSIDVVCSDSSFDLLLDCNNDDYFHPDPAPGTYLHTHWNVADSSFLFRVEAADQGPPGFVDVPEGHPLKSEVDWLAQTGVTRGCETDRFCPDGGVTRGQMAAFLHRYAPETSTVADPLVFPDVAADSPFIDDISWLAQTGITRGCAVGFCPDEGVTRGQMAAFLFRLLGDDASDAVSIFADVPADAPFAGEIAWMATAGISTGCGNGNFCPNDVVTRGQMAAFLHRATPEVAPDQ